MWGNDTNGGRDDTLEPPFNGGDSLTEDPHHNQDTLSRVVLIFCTMYKDQQFRDLVLLWKLAYTTS